MWGYGPNGMMGYGYGWDSMGWMMLFGGLLLVIVLVFAVVWVVRGSSRDGDHPPRIERSSSGLGVLEERYANGEIQRDEYLQKKRDLGG